MRTNFYRETRVTAVGTNFYRKTRITPLIKRKLCRLIDQEKFDYVYGGDPDCSLPNLLEQINERIHVCKRSGGWQIGFDHNWGEYYKPDRKSLDEFLRQPGTFIVDEYNREISVDDFWKMVDEWNSDPRNNWTSESYREWEKSQNPGYNDYKCYEDIRKVKEVFGIVTSENDFNSDGLRFSVFSDFI